jgi:hypothetical protein
LATQRTPNAALPEPQFRDRNWHLPLLAAFGLIDAAPGVGPFACTPTTVDAAGLPNSLSVTVAPGVLVTSGNAAATFAGITVPIPASSTVNLWVTEAGGFAGGSPWPTVPHVRVAVVVTGASAVTSITDARVLYRAVLGSPPAGADQAAVTDATGGSVASVSLASCAATTALTDGSGGTASSTIPAATNTSALTDSTGGTASTTLAAVADAPTANALASLAAQLAAQRALNVILLDAIASLASKVNGLRADAGHANDDVARLARLSNANRAALVAAGLMKGSA